MALVGEAYSGGNLCSGLTVSKQGTGAVEANVCHIGMDRHSHLAFERSYQLKDPAVSDGGEGPLIHALTAALGEL